ncbi:hypothetical protein [Paeniglutamicibacter sp.]
MKISKADVADVTALAAMKRMSWVEAVNTSVLDWSPVSHIQTVHIWQNR